MANYDESSTDQLILIDDTEITVDFTDSLSDGVVISDSSESFTSESIKNTDTSQLIISDSSSYIARFTVPIEDEMVMSDSVDVTMGYATQVNDNLVIEDSSFAGVTYDQNISPDTLGLSDASTFFISNTDRISFKNAMYTLLGTTEETIYTCTGGLATVINISICNRKVDAVSASIILYKGGVTPINITEDVNIDPHQSYIIGNKENTITLEDTDEIRVVTDTLSSCDVYMAIMVQ